MIHPPTLAFLEELRENNNREWFQANRKRYEAAKQDLEKLIEVLLRDVGTLQELGNTQVKDCIFRINRDVRFSKDKKPYKSWLSAAIGPGGRHSGRIDYYLQLQPGGESFLGAGMWSATPAQLAKYRQEIDYNAAELKKIIHEPRFRAYYPEIWGESTKTAPKGYAKDHPEIELLRRKQLFFMHRFTDKEVLSPTFAASILEGVALVKPFCDFLNYIFFEETEEEAT
ncbi:DUF2461 domain-containing protein [Rhabdobacter roseus]|uniref:Uncharacterized protein (TIGR02453 family) n=1 Tax=Rhabdobacter roseus TaxID=1655419 RepID=A0A840TTF7_9BACT|nr:DUF2461 domain-containing protein [Rhabdobacter roseus]MBB5283280.1 uncharacterized protein (TIGR02453 family) [Rhabdobacter roseus]